ncbi:MAG: hypothetical protein II980_00845 [Clostridia bacterium]|nr:hypothetical protein [Clostridia bacterium]
MCYICKQTPCHQACPDFENSSFDICAECGSYICQGQEFYELKGNKYHEECISMLTSTDILDVLKITPQVFLKEQ